MYYYLLLLFRKIPACMLVKIMLHLVLLSLIFYWYLFVASALGDLCYFFDSVNTNDFSELCIVCDHYYV